MPAYPPVFEQSTSVLYYSNDARLHVISEPHPEDVTREPNPVPLALARTWYRVVRLHDGQAWNDGTEPETVFTTLDRVKADAYIAGYDLATS